MRVGALLQPGAVTAAQVEAGLQDVQALAVLATEEMLGAASGDGFGQHGQVAALAPECFGFGEGLQAGLHSAGGQVDAADVGEDGGQQLGAIERAGEGEGDLAGLGGVLGIVGAGVSQLARPRPKAMSSAITWHARWEPSTRQA